MAALTKDGFFGFFANKPPKVTESRKAREFGNRVYKEMGGPTATMKRHYAELLENERRSKAES